MLIKVIIYQITDNYQIIFFNNQWNDNYNKQSIDKLIDKHFPKK